ncbi:MAG: DUF3891 family protein [Planctomycetota bacterium]|jgi:hypothetical protein
MFRLSSTGVVVSQQEHSRISGELASRWGNEWFDRPDLDLEAFVAGVTLHDWHYGVQDTLPLDAAHASRRDEDDWEDWVAIHTNAESLRMNNPVVETIAKMHVRRLLDDVDREDAERMRTVLDGQLDDLIAQTGISRERFEWGDRVTCACDLLAFFLFREDHLSGTFDAPTRVGTDESVEMRYEISLGREIRVDPWPFERDAFEVRYIGHASDTYPSTLHPIPMRVLVDRLG